MVGDDVDKSDFETAVTNFAKDTGIREGDIVSVISFCVKVKNETLEKIMHKVACSNPSAKWNFIKKARDFIRALSPVAMHKKVDIKPDLTIAQRKRKSELYAELQR